MIPSYLPIHRFSSSLQNALVLSWTLSSISKHLLDIIFFFFLISHCYLKYGLSKIELNIFCKFDSLYNLREIIKEIPVIYLFRSGTTNSSRPLPQPKDHTYIQFFTWNSRLITSPSRGQSKDSTLKTRMALTEKIKSKAHWATFHVWVLLDY